MGHCKLCDRWEGRARVLLDPYGLAWISRRNWCDLLSGPSPDIYGTSAAGDAGHFNKVDHCQFKTYNHKNNQCFFIEPTDRDVSQCLKACKRKLGTKCTGVNVVPLYNPSAVAIDRVNIPWKSTKCDQTMASQYDEGTLVCYGLKYKPAKKGGNPDVGYPWTVVDSDPEDPIFYSTCYTYQKSWSFEGFDSGSAKPQSSVVSYKAGDQCISCRDVDRIKNLKFKEVPWWKLAKECSKCSWTRGLLWKLSLTLSCKPNISFVSDLKCFLLWSRLSNSLFFALKRILNSLP